MPYSCPSASNSLRAESFIFVRLRLQSHSVVFALRPPRPAPPPRIISPSPPFFFSSKFQPLPSLNLFHLLKSLAASLLFVEHRNTATEEFGWCHLRKRPQKAGSRGQGELGEDRGAQGGLFLFFGGRGAWSARFGNWHWYCRVDIRHIFGVVGEGGWEGSLFGGRSSSRVRERLAAMRFGSLFNGKSFLFFFVVSVLTGWCARRPSGRCAGSGPETAASACSSSLVLWVGAFPSHLGGRRNGRRNVSPFT